MIANFLTNATKFTSRGSITLGYDYRAEGVRFYVTDTGKGIAAENLPHVFERFMKVDNFVQGTGLGLSICETIIQRLGGQIGVESELGKGSTFWFTLPCEVKRIRNCFKRCDHKVENLLLENSSGMARGFASSIS